MQIQLQGVTKQYGAVTALCPTDLKIGHEIIGLIGNNGAGKSTLIKVIAGLLSPDEGRVSIDGILPGQDPQAIRSKIGYLPETPLFYPRLTVEEILNYVAEIKAIPSPGTEINLWLATFHLTEKRGALIMDLSFGMKKKVSLAVAFMGSPPLIILDEPFNGLDVAAMEHLAGVIKTHYQSGGTLVLTSHLMEYIDRLCHRVIILKGGRIAAEGTPKDLKRDAQTASFHDAFLFYTKERVGETG